MRLILLQLYLRMFLVLGSFWLLTVVPSVVTENQPLAVSSGPVPSSLLASHITEGRRGRKHKKKMKKSLSNSAQKHLRREGSAAIGPSLGHLISGSSGERDGETLGDIIGASSSGTLGDLMGGIETGENSSDLGVEVQAEGPEEGLSSPLEQRLHEGGGQEASDQGQLEEESNEESDVSELRSAIADLRISSSESSSQHAQEIHSLQENTRETEAKVKKLEEEVGEVGKQLQARIQASAADEKMTVMSAVHDLQSEVHGIAAREAPSVTSVTSEQLLGMQGAAPVSQQENADRIGAVERNLEKVKEAIQEHRDNAKVAAKSEVKAFYDEKNSWKHVLESPAGVLGAAGCCVGALAVILSVLMSSSASKKSAVKVQAVEAMQKRAQMEQAKQLAALRQAQEALAQQAQAEAEAYQYVDEEGNPLSEEEVEAMRARGEIE